MSEHRDESPEALIGRRLGHYLVLDSIGGGAMGHVYRARDVVLRRTVALKVHRVKRGGTGLARFQQEGRALLALAHDGIAAVFEVGESGSHPYLAMELVDGPTLADLLRRGPLDWRAAASIGCDIAEALGHAHRQGMVHRDLKPTNVLVSDAGVVKLVDFGLAKQIAMPEPGEDDATVYQWSDVHTAAGAVLGTPAYMSPEQARAKEIDARADVFALGVVMHELVTGAAVFRRASPAATIGAILTMTPPRLDVVAPSVPAWLADIVARCLAKEPAARFADGQALATALREAGVERLDLRALAQDVAADRISAARTSHPSLRPASLVPPPRTTSRFLGRAAERRWLQEASARREPIVVIHGPAGVGKTRLLREHLDERGEDDAIVVDLTGATTEGAVSCAVAAALGATGADRIAVRLATRETPLLVLDGLVSPTLATTTLELVRRWHESAHRARFAMLTEDALDVEASASLAVIGLPSDEACELLLERLMSEADDPARVLDQRADAQAIVTCLTGTPLALELAARLAGPPEAPLLAPARAAIEAARTPVPGALWRAIEAAFSALTEDERGALVALAIVPAFDRPAATAITGLPATVVADWLTKLQGLGLVYPAPHPDLLGVARWALRETVRRFASRDAKPDLRARALRRAAKHYAMHAHGRRESVRAAPARESHREIARDEAGVLAVTDAAIADAELDVDGYVLESIVAQVEARPASPSSLIFLDRLDALAARAIASGTDGDAIVDALVARATLRLELGAGDARDEADRAIGWAARSGDPARSSRARVLSAHALRAAGELEAARDEAERAVAEARTCGQGVELGAALEVQARIALERADGALARAATGEARALAIGREDSAARLRCATLAAGVAREGDDDAGERTCLEEALELARAFGLLDRAAAILLQLGELEHRGGACARAADVLTQAAALHPESSATADGLRLAAAALALEQGHVARAGTLTFAVESDVDASAIGLAIAAAAQASVGRIAVATRLMTRAQNGALGDPLVRAAIELWRGHLDMAEQPGDAGIRRATERLDAMRVTSGDARPGSSHALAIAVRVLEARLPRRASLLL